jgi:retinol dehydrogenase 12
LHSPKYGAYTELWTALTPELTPEKSGAYVYPWGRFGSLPAGVEAALKGVSDGGTGIADKFVKWCSKETEAFAKTQ